jgi:hypothetical protein
MDDVAGHSNINVATLTMREEFTSTWGGIPMKNQDGGKTDGTLYAINKTAGKAYRRSSENGEWEQVDPKTISGATMERAGHQKIGDNWFSVFKTGEAEKK